MSEAWRRINGPVLRAILTKKPSELRQRNLNLVCKEWHTIIASSSQWRDECVEAGIPLVYGPSVDWHAHFISASKSNYTRKLLMRQVLRNENVFMTGPGGTGKTAMIDTIREGLEEMDVNVHVTALTAAAAQLIGGTTLHKWAGIGKGEDPVAELLKRLHYTSRTRIYQTNMLIIDEISMCSRDLFDKIDYICQVVRRSKKLFGGIQLLVSGDFFQLPPVAKRNDPSSGKFVFQSMRWQEGMRSVLSFEHIYRSSDVDFSDLLSRARRGALDHKDIAALSSRKGNRLLEYRKTGIIPTRMHSLRLEVQAFNAAQLAGIPGRSRFFDMEISASHAKLGKEESARQQVAQRTYTFRFDQARRAAIQNSVVQQRVEFKTNAQVILIVNLDQELGLVNGSRGVITDAHNPNGVEVLFACGITKVIKPYTWTRDRELSDNREPIKVEVKQIPLALGWATTVHKAQGMTLDCVEIDLGQNVFQPGMGYVALSRVRKMDALSLTNFIPRSVYAKPIVRNYYDYIAQHGTHAGFLEQLCKIKFPSPFRLGKLAKKLPMLTANRKAAREQSEREKADAEATVLSALPPAEPADLLKKYQEYVTSKTSKKRSRDMTLVIDDTGVSVIGPSDATDTQKEAAQTVADAFMPFAEAAASLKPGKEEEDDEEEEEEGEAPDFKVRRLV